jgi:hypothetical protein
MDVKIQRLFEAVKGEENKPLGEMRRVVRQHIVEAEKNVRETTEPDRLDGRRRGRQSAARFQRRDRRAIVAGGRGTRDGGPSSFPNPDRHAGSSLRRC